MMPRPGTAAIKRKCSFDMDVGRIQIVHQNVSPARIASAIGSLACSRAASAARARAGSRWTSRGKAGVGIGFAPSRPPTI